MISRFGMAARFCAAVAAATICATLAQAQDRVALVIGNGAYRHVPKLDNPLNDATDIAGSLTRLGFSVSRVDNASYDAMRRGLNEFGRRARAADMAVVYFAGHGMELGGENWLIPVDAEIRSDADVETEAMSLKTVIGTVEGASKLGLVILDACRNNPFSARSTGRSRSVSRGLARVEPSGNVLVAYAAKDGTTADDGRGRNSPFATALLKHLETPGLEIQFLFRNVRDEVIELTRNSQRPFVYGELGRQAIYLKPGTATDRPAAVAAPAPRPPAPAPIIASPPPPAAIAALPPPAVPAASGRQVDPRYPQKPITLIVPFAAGGSTDVTARLVGQKMGDLYKQPVVIENVAGAGGNLGTARAANAAADGYTLLISDTVILGTASSLYRGLSFDAGRDFVAAGAIASSPLVLVIRQNLAVRTVAELMAYLKANPGKLVYASGGNGTLSHLAAAQFMSAAGATANHVPYRGIGPALNDLVAGRVDMCICAVAFVTPHIASGKLRALAVTGTTRVSRMPSVPTVAESGLPGYEAAQTFGLVAPRNTPQPIVEKLNVMLRDALGAGDVLSTLGKLGLEPAGGTTDAFASLIKREQERWSKAVRDAGISPQ